MARHSGHARVVSLHWQQCLIRVPCASVLRQADVSVVLADISVVLADEPILLTDEPVLLTYEPVVLADEPVVLANITE